MRARVRTRVRARVRARAMVRAVVRARVIAQVRAGLGSWLGFWVARGGRPVCAWPWARAHRLEREEQRGESRLVRRPQEEERIVDQRQVAHLDVAACPLDLADPQKRQQCNHLCGGCVQSARQVIRRREEAQIAQQERRRRQNDNLWLF
eukprot:2972991-Pleurochrysis_carterae.AAC.1